MRRITALIIIIFSVLAGSQALSFTPEPPDDNNQWAFILAESVELYSKANNNSQSRTVNAPGEWLKVTASDRDGNNDLWFRVKINNREGWLFQTGVRLKMGGSNKKASGVYKNCSAIRRKVMNGTMKGWSQTQDGDNVIYSSKNGSFMVREIGSRVDDIYFEAHGESTCTAFLGFNALGMDRNELRKRFGPPTMRETPHDEPDVNILSYELSDRDMTLAMHMRRSGGSREARVEKMILYKGRTGDNDNLSTSERFDSDSESVSKADYEAPNDSRSDSDLPDETLEDLPSDLDLPEETNDLPDDSGSETKSNSKNSSVASQEKAAEILEGRLIDLGKIAPNETLEYSGVTEINNESCWDFSAQFNFSETGRYAISPTGKIYEYDNANDKFVSVK